MSRYIDIEFILNETDEFEYEDGVLHSISGNSAPSIDIVRCRECKYWVYNFNGCSRNPCTEPWYATDFCNYGERSRR